LLKIRVERAGAERVASQVHVIPLAQACILYEWCYVGDLITTQVYHAELGQMCQGRDVFDLVIFELEVDEVDQ